MVLRQHTPFDAGFGIYIHWPFCLNKCPYCDFNSHVRKQGVDTQSFVDGLVQELQHYSELTAGRTVTSIFFGGGTPSLMPPVSVGMVLDAISRLWPVASNVETTLEANPTSSEARNFAGYAAAGVNRLSVGIQSLNDRDLKFLGRQHTASEAINVYRLATKIFDRTSFDLIYARPDQSIADWCEELEQALGEQQGHMSIYQLTIEQGTRFAHLAEIGQLHIPADHLAEQFYDVTGQMCEKAGLNAYEVSNYALSGHESRHNMLYWQYGEYVGVGAGAHSRIISGEKRMAISNYSKPERWLSSTGKNGSGACHTEILTLNDQANEFLLMGLRLTRGINANRYDQLFNRNLNSRAVESLVELNLIRFDSVTGDLAATPKGRLVLNSLIAQLAD